MYESLEIHTDATPHPRSSVEFLCLYRPGRGLLIATISKRGKKGGGHCFQKVILIYIFLDSIFSGSGCVPFFSSCRARSERKRAIHTSQTGNSRRPLALAASRIQSGSETIRAHHEGITICQTGTTATTTVRQTIDCTGTRAVFLVVWTFQSMRVRDVELQLPHAGLSY